MTADQKTPFTVAAHLTARLIEIGMEHVFTIPWDYLQTYSNTSPGPTLLEAVIPEHDQAPQLRCLAESPPTQRRCGRAESAIHAVGNHGIL